MKTITINELEILGAVLPSIKEIENLSEDQRSYNNSYWLRSPGAVQRIYTATATSIGTIYSDGSYVGNDLIAVRPALVIENLDSFNLQPGEKLEIKGLSEEFSKYIVVNEHMLLADFDLGTHAFSNHSKGNDYWTSDIRKVVNNWFEENFEED